MRNGTQIQPQFFGVAGSIWIVKVVVDHESSLPFESADEFGRDDISPVYPNEIEFQVSDRPQHSGANKVPRTQRTCVMVPVIHNPTRRQKGVRIQNLHFVSESYET